MTEKLEIEVKTCSHLNFNVQREHNPAVYINLGEIKDREMTIEDFSGVEEGEVICTITNNPCVLHHKNNSCASRIDFGHIQRCPDYQITLKKYHAEGQKKRKNFYADIIKR